MMLARCLSYKFLILLVALITLMSISPSDLFSQTAPRSTTSLPPASETKTPEVKTPGLQGVTGELSAPQRPSITTQAVALVILALLPFIVMILTPFLKIVIVLSLLRSALGAQQAPPNQILNGVALMLSLFVMYPTALKMYDAAAEVVNTRQTPESLTAHDSSTYFLQVAAAAREPGRDFLKKNSSFSHQALFYRMAYRVLPEQYKPGLTTNDFMILIPSFITSQLKDAFEIGVLIYIPFFVIDLVTSNILLAMGMMMLSPVTISMPLKIFLLVMLDGWTLLIEGLVNTFH